jgi:hypothetical protein
MSAYVLSGFDLKIYRNHLFVVKANAVVVDKLTHASDESVVWCYLLWSRTKRILKLIRFVLFQISDYSRFTY